MRMAQSGFAPTLMSKVDENRAVDRMLQKSPRARHSHPRLATRRRKTDAYLKPQLGQTVALAEDLKRQVKRLAADYKQIAEVLRGV